MATQRYMIVEHPVETAELSIVDGAVIGQIPIHSILHTYHWHRLDKTHVILLGDFSASYSTALRSHSAVTVMPHNSSTKCLKHHFAERGKHAHHAALATHLDLVDASSMSHFLDAIEERLGPVFHAQK